MICATLLDYWKLIKIMIYSVVNWKKPTILKSRLVENTTRSELENN